MDEADTKKAVEMALSILQKCHSKMQEGGANSSDLPATTSEDRKESDDTTTRVSAVNSGRRYLPDNQSMKPILQNPSIAKETCILFSCSPSIS